jgi:stage V sporulation protein G
VNVQLRPVDNNNLKAAGQVTIDGCFVVKDVKVMTGSENKPFVSMPSYQTQTGDYAQYALPITKDFHEKLSNAVLRSYQSLGKTEYKGVKYAELGDKDSIAHLPKQNNKFAEKLMTELDKAGVKYQAKVEGTTTISVNKADMPKVTDIKNQLVKTLNPEKQTNSAPKYKR